jgi:aspartate racemase
MKKRYKIIGILGGMGPQATIDLYQAIIDKTPATCDQEHIPTIIFSYPQVPDRTEAITADGENPVPYLIKGAKLLEQAGADFILIPCNTAYHFLREVEKEVAIPIVNMITETRDYILREKPAIKRIGLLATSGTIKARVYHRVFEERGISLITPDERSQEKLVMRAIYQYIKKSGDLAPAKKLLIKAGNELISAGCESIIMGCTEVPLALHPADIPVLLVDPKKVIAELAVKMALSP